MLLDTIHSRQDLLDIPEDQLGTLCGEIRQFLVQNVSRTGGHLASNLGIVETTVAIHRVFDTSRCLLYTSPSPRDRTRSRMPSSA